MENHLWTTTFHALYDSALAKYRDGVRDPESFFNSEEIAKLASIGIRPIQVFDLTEDFLKYGEPDWDVALLMVAARRDYFLHEMEGKWTAPVIDSAELPAKTDALAGIVWLPRIIQKAEAFLKGALPPETMYGCGGDRNFFETNRVHAADFLRVVWAAKGDEAKVVDYVKSGLL